MTFNVYRRQLFAFTERLYLENSSLCTSMANVLKFMMCKTFAVFLAHPVLQTSLISKTHAVEWVIVFTLYSTYGIRSKRVSDTWLANSVTVQKICDKFHTNTANYSICLKLNQVTVILKTYQPIYCSRKIEKKTVKFTFFISIDSMEVAFLTASRWRPLIYCY